MVRYEWDKETYDIKATDPEAEVLDHDFSEKLINVGFPVCDKELTVLVRDNKVGKLWAYVDESRMLPKYFSRPEADGRYHETDVKVPQRFHREIAAYACKRIK